MDSPSSTSSSSAGAAAAGARSSVAPVESGWLRRVPWAGLFALALVGVADRWVHRRPATWEELGRRLEDAPLALVRVEKGIVADRLELLRLEQADATKSRIIAMGSSRALDGFQFDAVPPELVVAKIAHGAITPLEMRLFAREAAALHPALFVALLSELDTHRPVRIEPRTGFADLPAVVSLMDAAGPRFVLDDELELERLSTAALFETYRWHDVHLRAWLSSWIDFAPDADERLPRLVSHETDEPRVPPPDVPDLDGILGRFAGTLRRRVSNSHLQMLTSIRVGPHAAVQERLFEETVARLRAAGAEVLIVEGPLHPVSYELYDYAATRAEFLAYVEELRARHGVHFLPLEESGPWAPEDFDDPLHLRPQRGRELGRLTLEKAGEILGRELSFEDAKREVRPRNEPSASGLYDSRGRPIEKGEKKKGKKRD